MESGLTYYKFYPHPDIIHPNPLEDAMSKKSKPKHEVELDDDEVSDEEAIEIIIENCLDDVSEILAQAYEEVAEKVRTVVKQLKV